MCHTVAQIRRQERPMCLAEVIVRPLTMRLLDPWHFRRPHRRLWRLRLQLQPRLELARWLQACNDSFSEDAGFVLLQFWGGGNQHTAAQRSSPDSTRATRA